MRGLHFPFMIKIISTLVLVRLRKFLPKDDKTAVVLLVLAYLFLSYGLNNYFTVLENYILLFSLEILLYHNHRNDLELLKLHSNYKRILFFEYVLYSAPVLLVIFLNNWLFGIAYLILIIGYINIPKISSSVIKYPFYLFDPFCHITFRRNKLLLFLPVAVFLIIMGEQYHNDNLIFASIIINSVIAGIPSFNREFIEHIKNSGHKAEKYIYKQFKTSIVNTVIIAIPLFLTLLIFQKWEFLLYSLFVIVFPLINIVFKYTFFHNIFQQQMFVALSFGFIYLAVPFIMFPFLLYQSIKNIKQIQDV